MIVWLSWPAGIPQIGRIRFARNKKALAEGISAGQTFHAQERAVSQEKSVRLGLVRGEQQGLPSIDPVTLNPPPLISPGHRNLSTIGGMCWRRRASGEFWGASAGVWEGARLSIRDGKRLLASHPGSCFAGLPTRKSGVAGGGGGLSQKDVGLK